MRSMILAAFAALILSSSLFAQGVVVTPPQVWMEPTALQVRDVTFLEAEQASLHGFVVRKSGAVDLIAGGQQQAQAWLWLLDEDGVPAQLLTSLSADLAAHSIELPPLFADADDDWGLPLTAEILVDLQYADGTHEHLAVLDYGPALQRARKSFEVAHAVGGGSTPIPPPVAATGGGSVVPNPPAGHAAKEINATNGDGSEIQATTFVCKQANCTLTITLHNGGDDIVKKFKKDEVVVVPHAGVLFMHCDCGS